MIRHLVLVRFANGTDATEIAAIVDDIARLRDVLPGMVAFSSGANVSPEGLARGFTHAFTCDFTDIAARDAYLVHPAHRAAGARLVAAAANGIEGLIVLDFEGAAP